MFLKKYNFLFIFFTLIGHEILHQEDLLSNWTGYLDKFRDYIEKGFQFSRLAVQEPYGVMILKASYDMKHRFDNVTGEYLCILKTHVDIYF